MRDQSCDEKPIWTVAGLARVLPRLPTQLKVLGQTLLRRGPLSNAQRERVMLAVAAENRCQFCQMVHSTYGRASGLSTAEVQAILQDEELADLPPGERLALVYVRDLARREFASSSAELRDQLTEYFDERSLAAIETLAEFMNVANRTTNTLDVFLGRRDREVSLAVVAFLTPIFLPAAALAAAIMAALELSMKLTD